MLLVSSKEERPSIICIKIITILFYFILKLDEGKAMSKYCQFGSTKWFWPSICAPFAEAGKKIQKSRAPAKEECNKYD
jgi:hypothetical protein